MSDLYLRSVELSNFRIYGDSYAYELPDGPGVTLITGANGLGKTSFFDGVEWALTNRVNRFLDVPVDGRRKEPDPLTRIGAPKDSHRVSLQFSDGAPIDRGAGFLPNDASIARLLKRPGWADITNLHGYLSITHFLGQSSTQRFSLRKPGEQWEALKGPAGVDRINALRERMSGLGVRRAFTRAIEDRTKRLEEASSALIAWTKLVEERDRARHLSSSDQAVAPSEVRAAVEALVSQLVSFAPEVLWAPLSDPPEAVLDRFASLLRSVEQLNSDDGEAAHTLAKIVSAFEQARAETTTLSVIAEEIEARRSAAVEKLAQAESASIEAATALAASERQASQAQVKAVTILRIRNSVRQLDDSLARQASTMEQLSRSEAEAARMLARIDALRLQLAQATSRRAERRALADWVNLARRRTRISALLEAVRAEMGRLTALVVARDEKEIRERSARLAIDATVADEQISRLSAELRQHDDRLHALAEAVSAIVHRLNHDDIACPVCATKFPPGRLAELARAQVSVDSTPASELANVLADYRLAAENLRRKIADANREFVEIEQLQASMAAQRAREQELRQQLVEAGGSADGFYDESDSITLEQQLATMDDQLSAAATPEQISVLLEDAEALLNAETAKRLTLQRGRESTDEKIETARSTLRQHPDLWSADQGLLIDLDFEQATAESRSKELAERIAGERASLDDARLTRDALREVEARETEARASTNVRLDALAAERAGLTRRWTEAGQSGEPDAARLAQHLSRVEERVTRLEPIRATHAQLVSGYRKWLNDVQLGKLESEIASKIQTENVQSEMAVHRLLEAGEDNARRELELAQAARERIDTVGSQMQKRAETYADDVLVPLNATIKRFARTLMTWSDASIIYRAEHHVTRSELRPGIVRREADGSTTQLEMNPNLYFSEGQLSALSVAALLAASTTFGWSRWRGLLLDDPLQHNDVIHASAFMDLLRQMVRELGYQIILSTHDSAEAEFLGRKCRSAGIPYHVHELIPRGDHGLISAVA